MDLAPKLTMLISLLIFGTIGLVRRFIPLDSVPLALLRALLGCVTLVLIMAVTRQPLRLRELLAYKGKLLLCGLLLGLDWICFFESFNYTTVAVATLCYYMAPVFMLLAAPLVFHETLGPWKLACAGCTILGMLLVSGYVGSTEIQIQGPGVVFALLGALFYAGVIILNKGILGLTAYEKSATQLGVAALLLLPYTAAVGKLHFAGVGTTGALLILVLGVVHTGLAYGLYYGSLTQVSAQATALLSYVDPITAVLLSAFVLREPMSAWQAAGVCLVLGGMIGSEIKNPLKKAA